MIVFFVAFLNGNTKAHIQSGFKNFKSVTVKTQAVRISKGTPEKISTCFLVWGLLKCFRWIRIQKSLLKARFRNFAAPLLENKMQFMIPQTYCPHITNLFIGASNSKLKSKIQLTNPMDLIIKRSKIRVIPFLRLKLKTANISHDFGYSFSLSFQ